MNDFFDFEKRNGIVKALRVRQNVFGDDQNRTIQAKPSSFSCWFQIASASTRETELPDRVDEEIEVSEEARRLLSER